jgi:hypothetical protein
MSQNLFSIIRGRMPAPSRRFIETADGAVITYADMLDRTGRFANALIGRGVKPGDRVTAQVEKSADAIMLYLAVRFGEFSYGLGALISLVHDVHPHQTRYHDRTGLVFVGNYLHQPNVDAIHYFTGEIFPRIRQRLPGTQLFIVGSNPPPSFITIAEPYGSH